LVLHRVDPHAVERAKTAQLRAHVAAPEAELETLVLASTHPHPKKLFVERSPLSRLLALL
jgi:hypothetical protein